MKSTNTCRSLSMMLLLTLVADCKSDDNIFEITTAVSFIAVYYGTSSNKFYSAENGLKAVQFVQINWLKLIADMASGQGEYLNVMADLLGG